MADVPPPLPKRDNFYWSDLSVTVSAPPTPSGFAPPPPVPRDQQYFPPSDDAPPPPVPRDATLSHGPPPPAPRDAPPPVPRDNHDSGDSLSHSSDSMMPVQRDSAPLPPSAREHAPSPVAVKRDPAPQAPSTPKTSLGVNMIPVKNSQANSLTPNPPPEKKKSQGLFSSLFGKKKEPHVAQVAGPTNFSHDVHATWDPVNGFQVNCSTTQFSHALTTIFAD
jgi:hypothetical protein